MFNCIYTGCLNSVDEVHGICLSCQKLMDEYSDKCKKSLDLMDLLGIEQHEYTVHVTRLYDLFMDDEKMKLVISKLKNKAFW